MLNKKIVILAVLVVLVALDFVTLNTNNQAPVRENKKLMHDYKYGSYAMDSETQETS
ncbi:MAG: hypothetical protein ACOWW1_10725 [archaeon]